MKRLFAFSVMFFVLIGYGFSQEIGSNRIALQVKCYSQVYHYKPGSQPIFILGITNLVDDTLHIDSRLHLGGFNWPEIQDVLFELKFIKGGDTTDVLQYITGGSHYPVTRSNFNYILNPSGSYLFEFWLLNSFYLQKNGRYQVRFTLKKEYAPKYLKEDSITDWISFNVDGR